MQIALRGPRRVPPPRCAPGATLENACSSESWSTEALVLMMQPSAIRQFGPTTAPGATTMPRPRQADGETWARAWIALTRFASGKSTSSRSVSC